MRGLLVFVALVSVGCDKKASRVCGSLPAQLPHVAQTADDHMQAAAYCVERWAARLAAAPDDASEVVEAVLGACDNAITFLEQAKAKEQPGSEMAPDQARSYWRNRAQFIVVQTRAGDCYPNA